MTPSPIIVIGAGIAGASAAWHLAKRGEAVICIDKDDACDRHSSGRNAAILRTAMSDPALHALATESLDFYRNPPTDFCDRELFKTCGLFLAASPEDQGHLKQWSSTPACIKGQQADGADQLKQRVPALSDTLANVISLPNEGVFDLSTIHQAFLQGAKSMGCELRLNCEVAALIHEERQVCGVLLTDGSLIKSDRVVIANGAWAQRMSEASALNLTLTPKRRHLLVTEAIAGVEDWPVVWIHGDEYYFRPESGGLLISGCDQDLVNPDEGEVADNSVLELIAKKTARWLPQFANVGVAFLWAGMRTFAKDSRFVIGPDPRVNGAYWLAGLGGHGITCAPAAGRMLADAVCDGLSVDEMAPGRLLENDSEVVISGETITH